MPLILPQRSLAFVTLASALLVACSLVGESDDPTDTPPGASPAAPVPGADTLPTANGDSPHVDGQTSASSTSSSGGRSSTSSSGASTSTSSSGATSTGPRSLGASRQGLATFYDGIGPKNCGLDDPADRLFAAGRMDTVYMASAACGACFRVTGELGSVVLPVIDSCPITGRDVDCSVSGASLDLSPQAFDRIAPRAKGKVPVTFEPVSCPATGNLKFRFKEGSSVYWTGIQVRNHRVPVAKLEYKRAGAWVAINRVDYNYFIVQTGVGAQPNGLQLRITGSDGQVVEDTLASIGDGNVVEGHVQFR